MAPHWGQDVVRREWGTPLLIWSPRPHDAGELADEALRWASRTHLVQGERRLDFADVDAAIDRVAATLEESGLRRGEVAVLLAANSPEWVVTFWAALRAGIVLAVGNTWWSPTEVADALAAVRPRAVIADAAARERLPEAHGWRVLEVEALRTVVDAAPEASQEATSRPTAPAPREDDPALIVFTAGTTGGAKAALLPHRALVANVQSLLERSGRLPHQVDPDDPQAVSLVTAPLFHVGGVQAVLLAMVGGNRLVFPAFPDGRFDPGEVLDLIEGERVTWWGPIPTMASRVLAHPSLPERDTSSLRAVSMGGTTVDPSLVERLREAFPRARRGMSTVYGMTETCGTLASASGRMRLEHPTTAGTPMPVVEMRIAERSDGASDGEVVVRTPGQMLGYLTPDGLDTDTVDADGFLHTGDLGHLSDGMLFLTGRAKEIIIRGGENIAPGHVEGVLLRHPEVRAVAVLGLPDSDLGEVVAAVVQHGEGAAVAVEDLRAFAAGELAHFAVPSVWHLQVDDLPVTAAGKTDKAALRASWPGGSAGVHR